MVFSKGEEMPQEVIEKFNTLIPREVLEIWREYGTGKFLEGYIRIINPNEYIELVQDTYFRGQDSIPIFVTAFGDIITLEKGEFVGFINYKMGTFSIMLKSMKHFFRCIEEDYFKNKFFNMSLYKEARNTVGELELDECYGFVPLLGMGGAEAVSNIKKVKTREHIEVIAQLVGKIGM